jgi:hypothetical protein
MILEEQRSFDIIRDEHVGKAEPHCAFILGSIIEKSINVIEGKRIYKKSKIYNIIRKYFA